MPRARRRSTCAMGWRVPVMAHIPLIHGPDGAKLSKRHGALGVEAYRAMGYLPEAMRNYLVRLGWSHGDEEIFSTEQMIEWFDLDVDRQVAGALRLRQAGEPQRPLHPALGRCRIARAMFDRLPAACRRRQGAAGPDRRRHDGASCCMPCRASRSAPRRWSN